VSDASDAQRGQAAQAVLDSPIYAESYTLIESELTRKWRESRDPEEREHIHQLLRMLDKARNVLETVMRTGQLAEDAIRRKQSQAEQMADAAWKRRAR
jgi:hypothetical protein